MSIRIIACTLFVVIFSIYAWKKWFPSLCATILLMAVIQHPDMPKSIGGIQGLNLWNILMLNVFLAWFNQRQKDGLVWDLPRYLSLALCAFFTVILLSVFRLFAYPDGLENYSFFNAFSEYLINCFKWVIPGLLLYDGCRSESRVKIALWVILGVYFLLAIQVIRWVPWSAAISGDDANKRAYKAIQNEVGYNRVTLSMMLAGASWATLALLVLFRTWRNRLSLFLVAATMAFGQSLTGGRTGYVTWGAVGLVLCLTRWRKFLPLIPLAVLFVITFMPGVRDRLLTGFVFSSGPIKVENDEEAITSGRTLAWPYVIESICESPLLGYGREAMVRTGITQKVLDEYGEGESFPHPHNAYLEQLLDNGIIGFLGVMPFFLIALHHGFRLFLDRSQDTFVYTAIGGAAISLILALLFGSMGGQTFYPREGAVGLWATIGVMLRVYVERSRSQRTGLPPFAT